MSANAVRKSAKQRATKEREVSVRPSEAPIPQLEDSGLEDLVGYTLKQAELRSYGKFVEALGEHGITPPRFAAMAIIMNNPGIRQTDVGQMLGIAKSGVVKLVDALQAQGLVERAPLLSDRRAYALSLTPRGVEAFRHFREIVGEHERRITARLTPAQTKTLKKLLDLIGR